MDIHLGDDKLCLACLPCTIVYFTHSYYASPHTHTQIDRNGDDEGRFQSNILQLTAQTLITPTTLRDETPYTQITFCRASVSLDTKKHVITVLTCVHWLI